MKRRMGESGRGSGAERKEAENKRDASSISSDQTEKEKRRYFCHLSLCQATGLAQKGLAVRLSAPSPLSGPSGAIKLDGRRRHRQRES